MTRALIIGGGITGLSAALFLLREGVQVTLFDPLPAGDDGQASFGNAGLIARSAVTPLASKTPMRDMARALFDPREPVFVRKAQMLKMARFGGAFLRAGWQKFAASTEAMTPLIHSAVDDHLLLDVPEAAKLMRFGSVGYIYNDQKAFAHAKPKFELRANHGFALSYLEDGLEVLDPDLAQEFRYGAVFADHAWIVDPAAYMHALAAAIVKAGGVFVQEAVTQIEAGGVRTKSGHYEGEKIVVCAGAYSRGLLKAQGLNLPLEAERGYHLFFHGANVKPAFPYLHYKAAIAITPMRGGLRAAGLVDYAGIDHPPRRAPLEYLKKSVHALYPNLTYDHVSTWMGRRPTLPDSLPVIDHAPNDQNVIYAFGGQHLGLTMGPRLGMIARDLVLGRKVNIDLAPYSALRFSHGPKIAD